MAMFAQVRALSHRLWIEMVIGPKEYWVPSSISEAHRNIVR
jgi:hypothetical protein